MRTIPPEIIEGMLDDPSLFAGALGTAIEVHEEYLRKGLHEQRLDGWDREYGIWFSETNNPMEWLDLLMRSVEGYKKKLRPRLIKVIRYAVCHLPAYVESNEDDIEKLESVLPVYLLFIRERRLHELLPTLQQKSFVKGGWIKSDHLRPSLLLAAFSCSTSDEGHEFLRCALGSDVFKKLSIRQAAALLVNWTANLPPYISPMKGDSNAVGSAQMEQDILMLGNVTHAAMMNQLKQSILQDFDFDNFAEEVRREVNLWILENQPPRSFSKALLETLASLVDLGTGHDITESDGQSKLAATDVLLKASRVSNRTHTRTDEIL